MLNGWTEIPTPRPTSRIWRDVKSLGVLCFTLLLDKWSELRAKPSSIILTQRSKLFIQADQGGVSLDVIHYPSWCSAARRVVGASWFLRDPYVASGGEIAKGGPEMRMRRACWPQAIADRQPWR